MKFVLYALITIILLFSIPWFRILSKRIFLAERLIKSCKKHEFNLKPTHFGWMFGSIKGGKSDFFVETNDFIYSVKLFASKNKLDRWIFYDNHRCEIYPYLYRAFASYSSLPFYAKPKTIVFPTYDFNFGFPHNNTGKNLVSVLLLCPASLHVTIANGKGTVDAANGCNLFGNIFYTGDGFLKQITRQSM